MRITVQFEIKPNAVTNIVKPQNINFQNVSGNLIQEAKKYLKEYEIVAKEEILYYGVLYFEIISRGEVERFGS